MSKAEQEFRDETVQCRSCTNDVQIRALYIDGRRTPMLRPTCDTCLEAEEAEAAARGMSVTADSGTLTMQDWLRSIGVNTRKHGGASFESFDPGDSPKALEHAQAFAQDVIASGVHDHVRGLYLVGRETGVGKSHLAVAVIRAVREARPELGVIFEPADRLVTRVQDTYGSGTTDTFIEARARAGLYVLDDLGREKPTMDALRVLSTILDEREGAPTVITSNQLPHELGARHTEGVEWSRVASRLGDNVFQYVAVKGRDRRFRESA